MIIINIIWYALNIEQIFHMYAITGCLHITENMLLLIECVFLHIFKGTFFMFNMTF